MKNLGERRLGLTILFLSVSGFAQESPPALPGDVFSFQPGFDTLWGVAPLAYTNVIDAVTDDGYGLILDTTNLIPAYLNYKVLGNIYYPNGTILFYFAPNWASVSQGGTGLFCRLRRLEQQLAARLVHPLCGCGRLEHLFWRCGRGCRQHLHERPHIMGIKHVSPNWSGVDGGRL